MAKLNCAICGRGMGAYSSYSKLIRYDAVVIGLTPDLAATLSSEVECAMCVALEQRVRQSDPKAIPTWQQAMADATSEPVRVLMGLVLDTTPEAVALHELEEQDRTQAEEQLQRETDAQIAAEEKRAAEALMLTSGFNFEGYTITAYLGFISEETAVGMGFFKSIAASFSDTFGTESDSLRLKLRQSKQIALGRLRQSATAFGANAVIGLDMDYTMFSDSILGVVANGTAVHVVPNS